jgi:hypothetical protein
MRVLPFVLGVALLQMSSVHAAETSLPPEVTAVQKYLLEKDYPELYGDKPYRMRVDNALVSDLDGDGFLEVILQTWPHYRQSAPLTIFRISPALGVSRVIEGLAPGALTPLTGDYLDSHTTGLAADLSPAEQGVDVDVGDALREKFRAILMEEGTSVVMYRNFVHMDIRNKVVGKEDRGSYYIDMTHIADPPADKSCQGFEFARVKGATAGAVEGLGDGNVLAAWVDSQVYLYRINAILPSGLLDKTMWQIDVPANFEGFVPGTEGTIKVSLGGIERPLAVACNSGDRICQLQN